MPVEQLRIADIARLEKAMQKQATQMREHVADDKRQFSALESQQARMAGSLDVLVDNQAAMMTAFGVRKDNEEKPHKRLALMSQRGFLIQLVGAMGGLLVLEKIGVAVWPYLGAALKAIASIH